MRELKFRVWSKHDSKYLTVDEYQRLGAIHIENDGTLSMSPDYLFSLNMTLQKDQFVVEQWWDLPNIKNKGVFEGDIVECGEHRDVVELVGIRLEPFEYLSGMDVVHGVKPRYTLDTKVIGTIHDTPALLEQE